MRVNSPQERHSVCAVILNWNQPRMTFDCVRSTLAQASRGGHSVLVVDNGSTPENRAELRRLLPGRCVILQNDHNLGFAGGMNVGIQYALRNGFEYVWLLNNDAFPERDCLDTLVKYMDAQANVGVVTPRLTYPDGTDQQAGAMVDWSNGDNPAATWQDLSVPSNQVGVTAIGTALLLRCSVLNHVGIFDRRFFMYREEDDLCARITRAGYYIASIPEARCVHIERASSGGNLSPLAAHLLCRNGFLLLRNHLTKRSLIPALVRCAQTQLRSAVSCCKINTTISAAVMGGIWSAVTNRYGRPRLLTAPVWFERNILNHWWGISRLLNRTEQLMNIPAGTKPQFRRLPGARARGNSHPRINPFVRSTR
jgi:GT2 family glycosyltransferase